jgi:hypothetical protein
LFALLVGIGKMIFHQWSGAALCGAGAIAGALVLRRQLQKTQFMADEEIPVQIMAEDDRNPDAE